MVLFHLLVARKGEESLVKCRLVLGISMTSISMEDLFWGLIGHAIRTAGTTWRELKARRVYNMIWSNWSTDSARQKTWQKKYIGIDPHCLFLVEMYLPRTVLISNDKNFSSSFCGCYHGLTNFTIQNQNNTVILSVLAWFYLQDKMLLITFSIASKKSFRI